MVFGRTKITVVCLGILFLWFGSGLCEDERKGLDIFGFEFTFMPYTEVTTEDAPEDLKVETTSYHAFIHFPWFIEESKTVFINGISYYQVSFKFDSKQGDLYQVNDLYKVQYHFTLHQALRKNWTVMAVLDPAVASDMHGFSTEDIRADSGIMFGYDFPSSLLLNFGVMYSSNFGADMILPGFGIFYKHPKCRIFVHLPSTAQLWYIPAPWVELGLMADVQGSQFNIHSDDLELVSHVEQTILNTGTAARFYMYKGLYASLKGGYTPYRRLVAEVESDRTYDATPDMNWFVGASVGYQF